MDEEKYDIHGKKISIRAFTLPHVSKMTEEELKMLGGKDGLRKRQGFYVYRNKRLVVWGTWFRLARQGDLSKLARVQVDIPNSLDNLWALDIKKSSASPPEEIRKNLSHIIDKIVEGSKRTWTYRGRVENSDSVVHFWDRIKTRDSGIRYGINNKHPLIKNFTEKYPEAKRELYSILNQIECSIPLNTLYIDLTNDEKLINETVIQEEDALKLMKECLMQYEGQEKLKIFESLKNVEPFHCYKEAIENLFILEGINEHE